MSDNKPATENMKPADIVELGSWHLGTYCNHVRSSRKMLHYDVHNRLVKMIQSVEQEVPDDFDFTHVKVNMNRRFNLNNFVQRINRIVYDTDHRSLSELADFIDDVSLFLVYRYAILQPTENNDISTEIIKSFINVRINMFGRLIQAFDGDLQLVGKRIGRPSSWVRNFFNKHPTKLTMRDLGEMSQALNCELSVSAIPK